MPLAPLPTYRLPFERERERELRGESPKVVANRTLFFFFFQLSISFSPPLFLSSSFSFFFLPLVSQLKDDLDFVKLESFAIFLF
jgi:hypothetical protein